MVDTTLLVDFFTNKPIGNLKFDNIAVVGSSGNLLKTRLGEKIDSHEAVIRMNTAPVGRYKANVGSKTTIRIVAHNALKKELFPLLKECKYLIIWGAPQHYQRIRTAVTNIRKRYPKLPIYKFTQEAMQINDQEFELRTGRNRLLSGSWLSTGWFALFLAINVADKVTVCGYGCAKKSSPNTLYHYWKNLHGREVRYIQGQQKARKGHRFLTEMEIFVQWCYEYPITFI